MADRRAAGRGTVAGPYRDRTKVRSGVEAKRPSRASGEGRSPRRTIAVFPPARRGISLSRPDGSGAREVTAAVPRILCLVEPRYLRQRMRAAALDVLRDAGADVELVVTRERRGGTRDAGGGDGDASRTHSGSPRQGADQGGYGSRAGVAGRTADVSSAVGTCALLPNRLAAPAALAESRRSIRTRAYACR